jgi:hypothetical protein
MHQKVEEDKKLQIMIQQTSTKQKRDTEFNWTDRIKQWKKVQQAQGAVIDLSTKD